MLSVGAVAEARVDRTLAVAAPPTSALDATMNFLRESMRATSPSVEYARAGVQAAMLVRARTASPWVRSSGRRTRPEAFTNSGCSEYGKRRPPRQRLAGFRS